MILDPKAQTAILVDMMYAGRLFSQDSPILPRYEPSSAKMSAFHESGKQIRAVFGGNGSGKTEGGAYDLMQFISSHPGCVTWACGVTYDAVGEYIWPKIKKYIPDSVLEYFRCSPGQIAWVSSAREIPAIVRFPMWGNAEIRFKSYEQGRRKFQGAAVDYAWMDEEPPEEIFNEIVARVSRRSGRMILTMTPLMGLTWAYERIECADIENPTIFKTRIATGENKFFPREDLDLMIQTYGTDEAVRRIAGEFMQPKGAVWTEWRVERNVVTPFAIDREHPRSMGIDFGFSAPFACTWTIERGGRYYVVAEYQKSGLLLEDHVAKLKDEFAAQLQNTTVILADPEDAEARASLKKAFPGIAIKPANNTWQLGVDTVNRSLKSRGDADPKLFVFNSCKQTIYAASMYRFKPGTANPYNDESHLPDTVRYQMMHYIKPNPLAPQWKVSKESRLFGNAEHQLTH